MEALQPVQIYIASNYTIRPVKKSINYWMQRQGIVSNNIFSGSYQFIAQLYDVSSDFYSKENSFSIIFFRFENCFASVNDVGLNRDECTQFTEDLQKALNFAINNEASPIILIESPLSKKAKNEDTDNVIACLSAKFKQIAAELHGIYFESQDSLFDLYPMDEYHDDLAYSGALMPYSNECYAALGTLASRKISALLRRPKKVVVLDCDNTLWQGVVAEDGAFEINISDNYIWLQNFMVDLYEKGILLCLCSKNVEQDILDVFNYRNSDMPLKKEHFIAWRINWEPKSKNIVSLSKELNLGLDSFIFVDDNPVEIGEVKTACPDVECLLVPANPQKIPNFLKHQWVFDILHVSDSDKNRTEYYRREIERKATESSFTDYKQFLEHLNLELNFEEVSEDLIDRASQLTLRTNQFNFSGLKLSNSEVAQRINNPSSRCTLVAAKDRFGDYGEIGCLIYRVTRDSILLENFLLSCRALGKRIEYQIWDWLIELALQNGVSDIEIIFCEVQRNQPAYRFLGSLELIGDSFDGKIIRHKIPSKFN